MKTPTGSALAQRLGWFTDLIPLLWPARAASEVKKSVLFRDNFYQPVLNIDEGLVYSFGSGTVL